jgi:uncharacterized membrane protein
MEKRTHGHLTFWLLASIEGVFSLGYLVLLLAQNGGLFSSTGRITLLITQVLLLGLSAVVSFQRGWREKITPLLNNETWCIILVFSAFTLGSASIYLTWLSIITTDQQWYGILLRLRPLLLWFSLVYIQGLYFTRENEKITSIREKLNLTPISISLILVTLLGFYLRLRYINYPAHFDEIMSYTRFASGTAWTAVSFYPAPNNHVLHSLCLLLSTHLLGTGLPAIRLTAFIAGVLAIPATYLLGRRFYDQRVGLFSAALMAVSSYHIQYSVNGRGYTLVVLWVLLCFILADRLRQNNHLRDWLLFTLVSVLGFFTIPVMLYAYLGVMGWLVGSYWLRDTPPQQRKSFLLSLVLSGLSATLLTLLLYSPILLTSGWSALSANAFVESTGWPQFLGKLPGFLGEVWATWVRDFPPPTSLLVAAGVLISLICHKRFAQYKVWLGLPLVIGCGLVLLVQRAIPYSRVWLFLQPFIFILAAAGWVGFFYRILPSPEQSKHRYFYIVVLLIMAALAFPVAQSSNIYLERETGSLPQADQIADYLISQVSAGDVVLSNRPAYLILEYYFRQAGMDIPSLQSWQSGTTAQNIYLVVNEFYGENINLVVNTTDLAGLAGISKPELLKEFEGAQIYRVESSR